METFLTKNGTIGKKERERNNLAEGSHSRTERNDLKKVGTCPALPVRSYNKNIPYLHFIYSSSDQIFLQPLTGYDYHAGYRIKFELICRLPKD